MPDKVAFATSNWKDKPDKPEEFSQGEWDAYNSSKFNGFPFPTIEKAQDNQPFENWNKQTTYQGVPSKSEDGLISVLGDHYSYKFTYDQLFKFFWRMKGFKLKVGSFEDASSRTGREVRFKEDPTLSFDTETDFKNEESKLVSELDTNVWKIYINDCLISFDFNKPVLKLGEDDYRVFAGCKCCACVLRHMYPANLYGTKFNFEDLPEFVTVSLFFIPGDGVKCNSMIFYKLDEPEIYTTGDFPITAIWKTDFDFYDDGLERYTTILGISPGGTYGIATKYECLNEFYCGPSGIIWGGQRIEQGPFNRILFREIWNSYTLDGLEQPSLIQDSFPESVVISDGSTVLTGSRQTKILFDSIEPQEPDPFQAIYCPSFEYFVRPPILCGDELNLADVSLYKTSNSDYFIFYDYVFVDHVLVSDSCKWILNTPSGLIEKTGPQNSPLGRYGSFTVS
jgi:hypothetical protein